MHDFEDPQKLYEFLSPEVRRFAIAMERKLRMGNTLALNDLERPRYLHTRMLHKCAELLEAVSHPNVTDQLSRPLPRDHLDRNPRRVACVLEKATEIANYSLVIAEVCGALEIQTSWNPQQLFNEHGTEEASAKSSSLSNLPLMNGLVRTASSHSTEEPTLIRVRNAARHSNEKAR